MFLSQVLVNSLLAVRPLPFSYILYNSEIFAQINQEAKERFKMCFRSSAFVFLEYKEIAKFKTIFQIFKINNF